MSRIYIEEITKHEGEKVNLKGWVHNRRDHGKLIFIDLRDKSDICQVVFLPSNKEAYEKAQDLRGEWVINIEGKVNPRPKGMENPNLKSGSFEVVVESLEILNKSETPPFILDTDGYEVGEEHRLKYRYLDLRRQRVKNNLMVRHKVNQYIRNFLSDDGFVEIETPILTKSTPEGARDYVVPSRLQQGKFYALPQSPQQYKQLLMVGGLEKYFQIARCFRDEDTRGDRQPEFTQLDMEMSFVEQEDIMAVNEKLLISLVQNLFPEKKIQEIPFPRITYKEAIKKYNTDRPDIRKDKEDKNLLAFCWVIDFPFFEKVEVDKGIEEAPALRSSEGAKRWTFTHNPFSAPKPEFMKDLMEAKKIGDILTTQYDIVLNGWEIGGGSIRNYSSGALQKVFEIMGHDFENIKQKFGHMLDAFNHGAPPHGGIAWGLDRLLMILQNEPNIREVIAFPKTGDAKDLMMDSPSEIDKKQLKELGIKI